MNTIRKSVIISSMLAALAVVFLPSTASAQSYGQPSYGQPCYGYNCPPPRPRPQQPQRVQAPIEVLVQDWQYVPVTVAVFNWQWEWRWDSSCDRMNWVWAQVQIGTRTEYQWRQTSRWVTATWDRSCHKYVYWHDGSRREVTPWDTTRPTYSSRW